MKYVDLFADHKNIIENRKKLLLKSFENTLSTAMSSFNVILPGWLVIPLGSIPIPIMDQWLVRSVLIALCFTI